MSSAIVGSVPFGFPTPGPVKEPQERGKRESILDRVGTEHFGNLLQGEPGNASDLVCIAYVAMLRKAGLVVQGRGRLYEVPKSYLPEPGQPVVDFGHCLLRLDAVG